VLCLCSQKFEKSSHAGNKMYYLSVGDKSGASVDVKMKCPGHAIGVLAAMCVKSSHAVVQGDQC
jgi:hypothetical protein